MKKCFVMLFVSLTVFGGGGKYETLFKQSKTKKGQLPVRTKVLKGDETPVKISVDVRGVKQLCLIAVGVPNYSFAHSFWGSPELTGTDGRKVSLVDLKPVQAKVGWGNVQHKNVKGKTCNAGGKKFEKAIFAHSDSKLVYNLDGKYSRFDVWCGVDALAKNRGSVRFYVFDGSVMKAVEKIDSVKRQLTGLNKTSVGKAARDISRHNPELAGKIAKLMKQLQAMPDVKKVLGNLESFDPKAVANAEKMLALRKKILLSNPLFKFGKVVALRRQANFRSFPANWQSNSSLPKFGCDNEIGELDLSTGMFKTIYRPKNNALMTDVDLHFDANKMLFSMPGKNKRWQVFEVGIDGQNLTQVSPQTDPDVENYDACYLPNEKVLLTSTAPKVGVPCVWGGSHVANIFSLDRASCKMRQLCFDQEHNWNPEVMNNGQILYQRWEYTDLAHSNSRMLFTMNPDGTNQRSYYGTNSYWPNSIFYACPIPNDPSKVVGIVTGHHGVARIGEMVIFDPRRGEHEADGAVHKMMSAGKKVEPIVRDQLVNNSWPKFLHPYPLSEKYFLASAQPSPGARWGLYLVDVYDNMVLLKDEPGYSYFEPFPLMKRKRPPVIPERVQLDKKDATVYIADIYTGGGLKDIPRGTVKSLRLFTYTFSYHGVGGLYGVLGMDGPWDMRRVLGSVPVNADGSAVFKVSANIPIAIQPHDEEDKALAIMRSWFTAMPGETLACVGCHENRNQTPRARRNTASSQNPSEIKPWLGPARNYTFEREVQKPVLDRYCIGCHDGNRSFDLTNKRLKGYSVKHKGSGMFVGKAGKFSVGYVNLFPFVRGSGIESDLHMLTPMEFHADSTELVQILQKGHHGVTLDREAWQRLTMWIDLNTPYHGRWSDLVGKSGAQKEKRRSELRKLYAAVDVDHEFLPEVAAKTVKPVMPKAIPAPKKVVVVGWPLKVEDIKPVAREVKIADGLTIRLVKIPAGAFVMGSGKGTVSEYPREAVIGKSFWMAETEISNEVFNKFDPEHDSRLEIRNGYQFGVTGYPVNKPDQPAVRVSWNKADKFCKWLAKKTGMKVKLPTEEQWEWACRAGSADDFNFTGEDFSQYANLGDVTLKMFAEDPYKYDTPIKDPSRFDDYIPKDARFNDKFRVTAPCGSFKPNAWGLKDMHGNAAEWTSSNYSDNGSRKVVRGGSWRDRPKRSTSWFRLGYRKYHPVFNVGFRIIVEE